MTFVPAFCEDIIWASGKDCRDLDAAGIAGIRGNGSVILGLPSIDGDSGSDEENAKPFARRKATRLSCSIAGSTIGRGETEGAQTACSD